MILTFLGAQRTATWSLWDVLGSHPNIAPSKMKEPFNTNRRYFFSTERYMNEFLWKEDTKVLVDGTPNVFYWNFDIVKKINHRIKIIYPIRNPKDRIYSTIKLKIISHSNRYNDDLAPNDSKLYPDFIVGKRKIDKNKIIDFIPQILDSVNLDYAFRITNEVLIIPFEEITTDLTRVWEFLEVEPMDVSIPKYNRMNHWYKKPFEKVKAEVDDWIKDNKELENLIDNDSKILKEKYGVNMDRFNLVSLCTTTRCNAYCQMCSRTERAKAGKLEKADMDLTILFKILPRIDFISLNGIFGDYILHPNALAFLQTEEARQVPLIEIATNGASQDYDFWKQLGKLPNVRVIFGIDGLEDTHHIYRGTSYKRVMYNMKTYIENGGTAIWQFIVFRYNEHQIQEASDLAKDLGCVEFMPIRSNVYGGEIFKKPTSLFSRNELIESKEGVEYCYWKQREGKPFLSFFIDVYGYVHPCCHTGIYIGPYWEDPLFDDLRDLWTKNKDKLNLKDNDIDDILNNEYFRYIEDNFKTLSVCNARCYGKVDEEMKRCTV